MAKPNPVFLALADPTRRMILEALRQGGQTAGNIASLFEVSWPAISRHLRVLKSAGLIWETRDGRTRHYELNLDALRPAETWLSQFRTDPVRTLSASPGPGSISREYTS
jgi:DNA-binding transcriptional ArsR family regulator